MKEMEPQEARAIADKLQAWFAVNQRPLPWRRDYAPYAVWISEMMLQQTQMERGVEYFLRWMKRFPDVAHVAAAPEEDILHAWEGLGYYRRARYIHAAARQMVEHFGGRVPARREELESLPGLGPYTVAAILGIAFNEDVACVDANVERVLCRLCNLDTPPKKAAAVITALAGELLPPGKARLHNQAMMEFGALVCGKKPACAGCPLTGHCRARALGLEGQRPVQEARAETIAVRGEYGVLSLPGGVLLQKRPEGGLWGGLWQFPGLEEAGGLKNVFVSLGLKAGLGPLLGTFRHGYTNHKLTAHFYEMHLQGPLPDTSLLPQNLRLVPLAQGGSLAMPSHHRKMMAALMNGKRQLRLI